MKIKDNFFGFTTNALENVFKEELDTKPFVIKQVLDWVYKKGIYDFSLMSNLSKELRHKLEKRFSLSLPELTYRMDSSDKKATSPLFLLPTLWIEILSI